MIAAGEEVELVDPVAVSAAQDDVEGELRERDAPEHPDIAPARR